MTSRISISLLAVSCSCMVVPLLSGLPAAAVTVTVNSIDYDVTLFTGSYSNNTSLFQAISPGKMPWWGDTTGDTASIFAKEVFNQLGDGPTSGFGPVFAYDLNMSGVLGISQSLTNPLFQLDETIAPNDSVAYAIATPLSPPPPSPVPAPLPVFGAMAALGYSRRIRKRLSEIG